KRAFTFVDDTFDGKPGILNLTLSDPADGLKVEVTEEPPAKYRNRSLSDLKPEEVAEARRAGADIELPRAIGEPAGADAQVPEPAVSVNDTDQPSLAGDLWRQGLPALFNSSFGIGVLLLAALLFGAAHAFTPGHGKTLAAAYLVGERGTVGHAVLLGLMTTFSHTGSVLLLALLLQFCPADMLDPVLALLGFAGGLAVAGFGFWRLARRLTCR